MDNSLIKRQEKIDLIWKADAIDILEDFEADVELGVKDAFTKHMGRLQMVESVKTLVVEKQEENDNVKHPAHYTFGKIEVIDYIRDKLVGDKFTGYCLGNVLKYVSRYDKKGSPVEDLEKAYVYLGWAIESVKEEMEEPEDA